jgi:AraC-like DNA-binding protein/mannose-6-phosphate isomerase-like protein (cupin superfamily)
MIDSAGIRMAQGQTIACERIEGVNDNMLKSHYHDFYELYYLERGERCHMIQDKLYFIHSGQFVFFPPYVMHHSYGEKDIPFKRIVLYFRPTEIQSSRLIEAFGGSGQVYTAESDHRLSIHQLFKMILQEEENTSSFKDEYMHTLLNLLLLSIKRQGSQTVQQVKQTRIGQIVDYIHKHYFDNISLEDLSKEFYVSPYYLCREFKKCTNRTIIQYINITRIMNAQTKIMETNKSITEIANETGFSNITHFNRIFKSNTGITPSEYRKQYKNKARNDLS